MTTPIDPLQVSYTADVKSKYTILLVEHKGFTFEVLAELLKKEGHEILKAKAFEAATVLEQHNIEVVIWAPEESGKEPELDKILTELKALDRSPYFVLWNEMDRPTRNHKAGTVTFSGSQQKPDFFYRTLSLYLEKERLKAEIKQMQALMAEEHRQLDLACKSHKIQLDMGAKIHETLLRGQVPRDIPGVSIQSSIIPSNEVDGDFFEFYRPHVDVFDVVLGDVMGKGISSALIATAVKTQFLRFAAPPNYSILFDHSGWHEDLPKIETILSHVDESIVPDLIKLEYFVTLIYARFDLKKRTLTYLDCGFTKTIHWKSKEQKAVFLKGDNYPLGLIPKGNYESKEVAFKEKDIFVFYSDGVTEARSEEGQYFDVSRFLPIIQAKATGSSEELQEALRAEFSLFSGDKKIEDDLTIIVVKIDHVAPIQNLHPGKVQFAADLTQLKAARELVGRAAMQAPGDYERLGYDLKLAINEIFCNIVKHGYLYQSKGQILIQVEHDLTGIKIEISDQGIPFDPLRVTEPSLYGDRDDGYGWYIIRQLVEQVMYLPKQSEEGWNHLRIYKNYCTHEEHMDIIHRAQGNTVVITPLGENLDAKETPEFKEKVLDLIKQEGASQVIIDLKDLQFIDSSGLGCLLSILRKLNADSGELKLCNMTKPVRSMFELVSMHKIFEIYGNTEEAMRSIKVPRES